MPIVGGTPCEIHYCLTCGVVCALPEALAENHRQKGGYFHCVNGHSQGWSKGESENEKTRRERDLLKQENARLAEVAATAQRGVQAAKLAVANARKSLAHHKTRSAAGVCPCCTRSFSNMTRHMKTKHPDFNVVPMRAA